jgi:HlyD family secretion protein
MSKRAAGPPVLERALLGLGARIHSDARDFRPAIVRLEDAPPSPVGRWVLWAALVFLASLLAWSVLGRLDVVAVAEGRLVPHSYLKIVQPADAGVVKEILVREGESVGAGQVLMRMDAALSDSDLKSLTAEVDSKRLALRRIDAELAGSPLTRRADEPAAQFTHVLAQYHANRQAYETGLAQERATLDKARFELRAAEEVRNKLRSVLPHYRSQEAAYEKLTRDGFAGRLLYTDKQRERIEKEQDLRAQEAAIESASATIAQQEKRLAQLTADYRRQLQTERVGVAAQLERLTQELAKQEHRHTYLELRAPAEGRVKDLATHTVGTVVSPGTILMTLVPKDEALRAEVWVRNDDIGFVREQQPVKLKLAAFTFQKYGMVKGTVAHLSADASEQAAAAPEATSAPTALARGALAYRTLVDLTTQTLEADGVTHRLSPGMQVTAEIHLGTRTVLEYLLSPVRKGFHEAARER